MRFYAGTLFIALVVMYAMVFTSCQNLGTGPGPSGNPQWKIYTTTNTPMKNNGVRTIYIDYGNTVWIGTDSGAYSYRKKVWNSYFDSLCYVKSSVAVRNAAVLAIAQGYDGSMWFGTQAGGVVRYKQSSKYDLWRRYMPPLVPSSTIISIGAESVAGEVWFGSYAGIGRFVQLGKRSVDDTSQEHWGGLGPSSAPIPTGFVTVAAVSLIDNVVWFGTANRSLARYDPKTVNWTSIELKQGFNRSVTGISFENTGNVWISAIGGIFSMNSATFVQQSFDYTTTKDVIPNARITAVAASDGHTRWFGSDSGLVKMKDGVWSRLTTGNSSLPDNHISALQIDHSGNLWIGTPFSGLAEYNENGIVE